MHGAQLSYSLAFASVSLLEVGFGPIEKIEVEERELASAIYHHENITQCSAMQFALHDAQGNVPVPYRAAACQASAETPERREYDTKRFERRTSRPILTGSFAIGNCIP